MGSSEQESRGNGLGKSSCGSTHSPLVDIVNASPFKIIGIFF